MVIKSRLVDLRLQAGYSRKTLSSLADVPYRTIVAYEDGTRLLSSASYDVCLRLARALRLSSVDDLFFWEG